MVIDAGCHTAGTNRRTVVTNRAEVLNDPQGFQSSDLQRGESENCNREPKGDLSGDRLRDHRFVAIQLRLYLHAAALNLANRMKRQLSDATPEDRRAAPRQMRSASDRPPPPNSAAPRPRPGVCG